MSDFKITGSLDDLLRLAAEQYQRYRIPEEAALLHALAVGSALAGNIVSSKHPEHGLMPAKFSAVFRSADERQPDWLSREWQALDHLQEVRLKQSSFARPSPHAIAELRRELRINQLLTHRDSMPQIAMKARLDMLKNQKDFRWILRVGRGPIATAKTAGKSVAFVAAGQANLDRILKSREQGKGYWSILTAEEPTRANLIGWVAEHDWTSLVRKHGIGALSSLGWVVECPETSVPEDAEAQPLPLAVSIGFRLEVIRLGSVRYTFKPTKESKRLLERHDLQVRDLFQSLPQVTQAGCVADLHLAWHLAAILGVLRAAGTDDSEDLRVNQCTCLGIRLANWAIRQHFYLLRHAVPCDHAGEFSEQDRQVFRVLRMEQSSVRTIQRRLRGVSKDACLSSLMRAVQAGLARQSEAGEFCLVPPPSSEGLSEFMSEFDQGEASAATCAKKCTDSTDKATTPQVPPPSFSLALAQDTLNGGYLGWE